MVDNFRVRPDIVLLGFVGGQLAVDILGYDYKYLFYKNVDPIHIQRSMSYYGTIASSIFGKYIIPLESLGFVGICVYRAYTTNKIYDKIQCGLLVLGLPVLGIMLIPSEKAVHQMVGNQYLDTYNDDIKQQKALKLLRSIGVSHVVLLVCILGGIVNNIYADKK